MFIFTTICIKTSYKKILELNFCSCSYYFPIDDILFAEARNRKVFIYTENNTITELPTTFQHFLELIPDNTFNTISSFLYYQSL